MLTLKMSLLYYGVIPMNNYPDDIRSYDLDPRSPFYIEPPKCEECEVELDSDVDCDEDGYFTTYSCENVECVINKEEP